VNKENIQKLFCGLYVTVLLSLGLKVVSANTVNDYIIQQGYQPVGEELRLGGIHPNDCNYPADFHYDGNRPSIVIIHETANPQSNIESEIAFMSRNQNSAFVHTFVDARRIITVADPAFKAWGAGPNGNRYGIHIENVEMHSKVDFARELANCAGQTARWLHKFDLGAPRLITAGERPFGGGNLASHSMVSRYLGGTDHTDPDGYWSERAARFFGAGYNMNDFCQLTQHFYEAALNQDPPTISRVQYEGDLRMGTFNVRVWASAGSGIRDVKVPIWSQQNQSDIKWCDAKRQGDGTFLATFEFFDYNCRNGNYYVHVYAYANNGKDASNTTLQAAVVNVPSLVESTNVTANDVWQDGVIIDTAIFPRYCSGIVSISSAVWSEENDQDDLIWYPTKRSENNFRAIVELAKHKHLGKFIVHTYAKLRNGKDICISTSSFEIAKPSGVVEVASIDNDAGVFDVVVTPSPGVRLPGVQISIWSQPNKSDLKRYGAVKQADGTYRVAVDIANHNWNLGPFTIRAHAQFSSKITENIGEVVYPGFSLTGTTRSCLSNGQSPAVVTTILQGAARAVASVYHQVWREENGPVASTRYPAKCDANCYKTDVDLAEHGGFGKFIVHTYAKLRNGQDKCVSKSSFEVARTRVPVGVPRPSSPIEVPRPSAAPPARVPRPSAAPPTRVPRPSSAAPAGIPIPYVMAVGAPMPSSFVGVWGVPIPSAPARVPRPYVMAVGTPMPSSFMGEGGVPKSDVAVDFASINNDAGGFDIVVTPPPGVWLPEVQVLVWTRPDKSDTRQHNAARQADGTYRMTTGIADHNWNFGPFNILARARLSSGRTEDIGETVYSGFNVTGTTTSLAGASPQVNAASYLQGTLGAIETVTHAVWSEENGQDDLIWYPTECDEKCYRSTVDLTRHKHNGNFFIHTYAKLRNGQNIFLSGSNFYVSREFLTLPQTLPPTPRVDLLNLNGVDSGKRAWLLSVIDPAIRVARKNKLYPSVMLAQAISESAWGESELARNAHNFFGIKADATWRGQVYRKQTQEFIDGRYQKVFANFRKYDNLQVGFDDYADKIHTSGGGRYRGVWRENAPSCEQACHALQSGGYATSPTYAKTLIDRINRLNLKVLD